MTIQRHMEVMSIKTTKMIMIKPMIMMTTIKTMAARWANGAVIARVLRLAVVALIVAHDMLLAQVTITFVLLPRNMMTATLKLALQWIASLVPGRIMDRVTRVVEVGVNIALAMLSLKLPMLVNHARLTTIVHAILNIVRLTV